MADSLVGKAEGHDGQPADTEQAAEDQAGDGEVGERTATEQTHIETHDRASDAAMSAMPPAKAPIPRSVSRAMHVFPASFSSGRGIAASERSATDVTDMAGSSS